MSLASALIFIHHLDTHTAIIWPLLITNNFEEAT